MLSILLSVPEKSLFKPLFIVTGTKKGSYPFGYEPFLCCRTGLDEKGVPAKIESSWGEEESRNEVKAHQPDAPAEYSE